MPAMASLPCYSSIVLGWSSLAMTCTLTAVPVIQGRLAVVTFATCLPGSLRSLKPCCFLLHPMPMALTEADVQPRSVCSEAGQTWISQVPPGGARSICSA